MANVLITGGTGLLGKYLTNLLTKNGYNVSILSRTTDPDKNIFSWDIKNKTIDLKAIESADYIIHLAGAGVAEQSWTKKRKKEIIDSRVESTLLLADVLKNSNHHVKAVIAASATGFYGSDTGTHLLDENSPAGTDFLAEVTTQWEKAENTISEMGIRLVKIRIGVVFSKEGGALPKIMAPIKIGLGAVLGSGKQYMSWIHIHDLCQIFIKAMEDDTIGGTYNAVAPNPVTNKELTHVLASHIGKKIYFPPIPSLFLKLALGEMSIVVTGGSNVSSQKILSKGYEFKFGTLEKAIEDLLQ